MKLNAKNEEFIPNSELPWYMSADPILTSCNENVHVKLLYILFHSLWITTSPFLENSASLAAGTKGEPPVGEWPVDSGQSNLDPIMEWLKHFEISC